MLHAFDCFRRSIVFFLNDHRYVFEGTPYELPFRACMRRHLRRYGYGPSV